MSTRTSIHLHLPRARRGDTAKWSVKTGSQPVRYAESAVLTPGDHPLRFTVAPSGQRRFEEDGLRSAYAFVRGYLGPDWLAAAAATSKLVDVVFDTDLGEFTAAGEPVTTADLVLFGKRVLALNPR